MVEPELSQFVLWPVTSEEESSVASSFPRKEGRLRLPSAVDCGAFDVLNLVVCMWLPSQTRYDVSLILWCHLRSCFISTDTYHCNFFVNAVKINLMNHVVNHLCEDEIDFVLREPFRIDDRICRMTLYRSYVHGFLPHVVPMSWYAKNRGCLSHLDPTHSKREHSRELIRMLVRSLLVFRCRSLSRFTRKTFPDFLVSIIDSSMFPK